MEENGKSYHHVKQKLAFGTVQYFHQVADALLPHIESVLSSWSGADVFPVAGEAAFLPHSFVHQILKFLDRFGLPVLSASHNFGAVVNPDHPVWSVDEVARSTSCKLYAFHSGVASCTLRYFVGRLHRQSIGVQNQYTTSSITREYVIAATVERGHYVQIALDRCVERIRKYWCKEKVKFFANLRLRPEVWLCGCLRSPPWRRRVAWGILKTCLHFSDGIGPSIWATETCISGRILPIVHPRCRRCCPSMRSAVYVRFSTSCESYKLEIYENISQACEASPYRTDGMDVRADDLRYSSCEKIPNYYSAVVTSHRKQRASLIERACHRERYAVQSSVEFLKIKGTSHRDLVAFS